MNENEERNMLRAVFDALPSFVLVVDHDVRIQEYNRAASNLLRAERTTVLKMRAGDILHCIHAREMPDGCGAAPFCRGCIIRASVAEAFQGSHIVRRRTKLELIREDQELVIYALITVAPFPFQGKLHALLVIEDITEVAELQRMIPICSVCRKVRDDKDAWMQVEAYFKSNWDVDFTHGLCPSCYSSERTKFEAQKKPNE